MQNHVAMLHALVATIVPIDPLLGHMEFIWNIGILGGLEQSRARHQKAKKGLTDPRKYIMRDCSGLPPEVAVTRMGQLDPILPIPKNAE
jgi:hypothetical protein